MKSNDILQNWRNADRRMLLEDVVPFWMRHGRDREHGGLFHYLERNGELLSTDKAVWLQGRAAWLFAFLYNSFEKNPEWLAFSDSCRDFLLAHGFDSDGRMFFSVTREGRSLLKRRYLFSEIFAIMGFAENAVANRDEELLARAVELFRSTVRRFSQPDATTPPKINPQTRRMQAHSGPMVLMMSGRTLRSAVQRLEGDPALIEEINAVIDNAAETVQMLYYRPDLGCVLERVLDDGSYFDTAEGRVLCPGHAIESAWFLIREGAERAKPEYSRLGADMMDLSLKVGWDNDFGGILYYCDAAGKSPDPIEHDMKLWWPHAESMCATLIAYEIDRDEKWLEWHRRVRDWTLAHFPDPEFGEWYGYLRRDGVPTKMLKGNMWKGPFHVPRGLIECIECCSRMLA